MKNLTKMAIAIVAVAGIAGAAYSYAFSGTTEEKSVMAGKIVSVVEPGTAVKEGDVLATVTSLAGTVPASRAAADGIVKEVKVVKGQNLNKQDVVAVVEYR